MALWGGVLPRQQINGSNNSTTHCALIPSGGAGYCWLCGLVQSPGHVGVLTAEEQAQLEEALNVLLKMFAPGHNKSLKATPKISIAGGRQTDRQSGPVRQKAAYRGSRNDQVATDLKLWCKDTVSSY